MTCATQLLASSLLPAALALASACGGESPSAGAPPQRVYKVETAVAGTEDIRVTVHHQFYLSTPYVNAIFGDEIVGNPGHYATEIVAGYTLVNQGRYDTIVLEYDTAVGRENEFLLPH